jgi:DNA-binding PadR family transcriptional regulator
MHQRHRHRAERAQRRDGFGGPPWAPGGFGGPGFGGPGFGGPGFGRGHHGRGRGRRTKRGNVRAAILALLAERPMHGYEMIQEIEARTEGVWRPSPGSVYPTLQLLEDESLVTSEEQGGKRLFKLTETGRAEAELQTVAPWDEVTEEAGENALHAREAIGQLIMALRQVMMAGTEEQKTKALEIITDARKRLYGVLADDGE